MTATITVMSDEFCFIFFEISHLFFPILLLITDQKLISSCKKSQRLKFDDEDNHILRRLKL